MIINKLEQSIFGVGDKLLNHNFSNKYGYAAWLSQAYYFVRHSTPMLALSAGLSVDNRPYHLRCIEHLSEEKGHDKLLLNDLKTLGYNISNFPELAATKALYQTQYYWIQHKNPISFLGYIVLLEGLAIHYGAKIYSEIKKFPGNSFIEIHTEDDVEHLKRAFQMIESLPSHEQKLIIENCELSAYLYKSMLNDLGSSTA
ncbi:MAG: iron-containing redox enzyme family protein, partial [Pseudobdellovibrionaceae bacterium]